jgi:hypothetical protein
MQKDSSTAFTYNHFQFLERSTAINFLLELQLNINSVEELKSVDQDAQEDYAHLYKTT